jgi:ribosomal protein L37AE/L43A
MSLRGRVDRLEGREGFDPDRCPDCPRTVIINAGDALPTCPTCGRPVAGAVEVTEVVLPDRGRVEQLRAADLAGPREV